MSRSHNFRQIKITLRSKIILSVISSLVRKSIVWETMIWKSYFLILWGVGWLLCLVFPWLGLFFGTFFLFFSFSSFVDLTTLCFVGWNSAGPCYFGTSIFSFPFCLETVLDCIVVSSCLGLGEVIFIGMKGLLSI